MKKAILVGAFLSAATAAAQPAPVGPPPNRTDTTQLPVSSLTSSVRNTAQTKVNQTNQSLQAQGKSSRASIESIQVMARPRRVGTDTWNRPNSWHVRVPYMVTIKVDVPVTSDRHIHIPIDVNMFCDNWQTGQGLIVARSQPGPASFEGGNILEDVFNVGNFINSQVRNAFTPPLPVTTPLNLTKCNTIGATDLGTPSTDDDAIVWDVPRIGPLRPPVDTAQTPTIEVTFDRLKRLRARRLPQNTVLYNDVETFLLNAFANYNQVQKSLTMREGDDVALNLPTVRLPAGTYENLVVIGNVEQPPNNPKDSAFAAATRAQNYAAGSHVLQIPKWYSRPPDRFHHTPTLTRTPAYELRYTVRYINPEILHP